VSPQDKPEVTRFEYTATIYYEAEVDMGDVDLVYIPTMEEISAAVAENKSVIAVTRPGRATAILEFRITERHATRASRSPVDPT
jgi:hypothetical protein